MGDLFNDDIQNSRSYPDDVLLQDVRALVKVGQREITVLDYKKDIFDNDNWSESAAAFAR
jgi:hypothetical protein